MKRGGVRRTLLAWVAIAAGSLALSGQAQTTVRALGPDFVEIPEGPFTMGAGRTLTPDAFDNERWSQSAEDGTLTIPTFFLALHEVTVAEFGAFAAATGWRADPRPLSGSPQAPVAFVTWPEALAYGRWLSTRLVTASGVPAPTAERLRAGWRVTLPTEAQWEKAARGGDRRIFPGVTNPEPTGRNSAPRDQRSPAPIPAQSARSASRTWRATSGSGRGVPTSRTPTTRATTGAASTPTRSGSSAAAASPTRHG